MDQIYTRQWLRLCDELFFERMWVAAEYITKLQETAEEVVRLRKEVEELRQQVPNAYVARKGRLDHE